MLPNATSPTWDAIVIGGGPAGSTAATTLAQAGRTVLVLEKAKFPRYHIGESLLPYNRRIFDEIGVWDKLSNAGFTTKRAAQFVLGNGSRANRLDFAKGSFTEYPEALQVERAKFDDILLQHSRESGAEVREQSQVLGHLVGDHQVSVRYRSADGAEHEVTARYLIDASGLGNFTANQADQREYYASHRKLAIFSQFAGVKMPTGERAGDIIIVRREQSWMWLIPLSPDKTSIGLVIDAAEFKQLGTSPREVFDQAVASTPAVQQRFPQAVLLEDLHVIADFSYKNARLVSPRVLRAGDASGFIDPMFSSGVLLAMISGRQGAQAIHQTLAGGQPLSSAMKRYERDSRRRIAIYWEFIENFYQPHFAQLLFQPYNRWRLVCSINAVLAGRTDLSFAVWWRLRVFFLIARLNRHVPVVKRIEIG